MAQDIDKKITDALTPELSPRGYTMEELRYRMAITAVKKELCKDQLASYWQGLVDASPLKALTEKKAEGKTISKGLLGKFLKGLDYADYVVLGMSAFKAVKKIATLFKRKKK